VIEHLLWQVESPEFKLQSHKKKKKIYNLKVLYSCSNSIVVFSLIRLQLLQSQGQFLKYPCNSSTYQSTWVTDATWTSVEMAYSILFSHCCWLKCSATEVKVLTRHLGCLD
jgi:hypothetical protein